MRRTTFPPFSPLETQWLIALTSGEYSVSSAPDQNKLLVWLGATCGMNNAEIAKHVGISGQGVSKLLKMSRGSRLEVIFRYLLPTPYEQADTKRVADALLSGDERRIKNAEKVLTVADFAKLCRRQTGAGRPGHAQLKDKVESFEPADVPVFELATLYISRDVQIASIAIREGRLVDYEKTVHKADGTKKMRDTLEEETNRTAKEIVDAASKPVHWTRVSVLDTLLADIFQRLRQGLSHLQSSGAIIPSHGQPPPLSARFGNRFGHIILSHGPQSHCNEIIQNLTTGVVHCHLRAKNKVDFLNHLEAAIHDRRLRKSCIGMLPMIWPLYDAARNWALCSSRDNLSLGIHAQENPHLHEWIKRHAVTKDYFAAAGMIPEMSSSIWGKILYMESIPFHTISNKTQVTLTKGSDHGKLKVQITPLPGYSYEFEIPQPKSTEKRLKLYQEKFKDPLTRRFVYSTRRGFGELRESSRLPKQFFLKNKTGISGSRVVLFPRHFLTPEPALTVAELDELSSEFRPGVSSFRLSSSSSDLYYAFNAPQILEEIRCKLRENWYQDRTKDLNNWQNEIHYTTLSQVSNQSVFLRVRPMSIFGKDAWDWTMHTDEPQTTEEVSDRDENITKKPDDPFDSSPQPALTQEQQLINLLTQVDADFLLSGFSKSVRTKIENDAEKLTSAIQQLLQNKYWPEGKLNLDVIRTSLFKADGKAEFTEYESDIASRCNDLLLRFSNNLKYPIRASIENMQRLALNGFPPRAIMVVRQSDVIDQWHSLLKKTISAVIFKNRSDNTVVYDEEIDYSVSPPSESPPFDFWCPPPE